MREVFRRSHYSFTLKETSCGWGIYVCVARYVTLDTNPEVPKDIISINKLWISNNQYWCWHCPTWSAIFMILLISAIHIYPKKWMRYALCTMRMLHIYGSARSNSGKRWPAQTCGLENAGWVDTFLFWQEWENLQQPQWQICVHLI